MLVARGVLLCEDCARDAVRQFDAIDASGDDAKRFPFRRRDVGPPDTTEAVRAIERCFGAIFGPFHAPIADSFWAVEAAQRSSPCCESWNGRLRTRRSSSTTSRWRR
jgi:hypothetical protein